MKVICSSEESLNRPEAVRWRQRMEMMEPLGDTVVLLPCSMKKPYSDSKSHQKFRKLTRSFQELIVTSPFGICTRELENTFPIQSYDVSTTGSWSADEIEATGRLIAKYCEGKNIVANLAGGYLESLEAYVDDFTNVCVDELDEVLGRDAYLQAPYPGAHIDAVVEQGAFVDECGKGLFHADGRAAAADVAGQGQELLDVQHFAVLVAGNAGGGFQVHLQ